MSHRSNQIMITDLPPVHGSLTPCAKIHHTTWFQVGGPAEVLFKPADLDDLTQFLKHKSAEIPHVILGVGSNVLIRDGGIQGVVIKLGRSFVDIQITPENHVICGASALDVNVAKTVAQANLTGLEFLSGIPGTIGGALRMNAGSYGTDISQVLVSATAIDPQGCLHILSPEDFGYGYRHCTIPHDWIFTQATLKASPSTHENVKERMNLIQTQRQKSQPIRSRTGGSTFKNPKNYKAWELIDKAGCRGLIKGDAQISSLHCNFLINLGKATANDLESLGEHVRKKVLETSSISLTWEIQRLGTHLTLPPTERAA